MEGASVIAAWDKMVGAKEERLARATEALRLRAQADHWFKVILSLTV